ncbi:uncharacterized protein BDZ99DRAFT_548224 [Mytilinidion resinicola]|uniref:Uncharacterized protein n=1 Tax=Mytilinidion resinicola TaxID=574789 RepID=A0A6A6Y344_9PEZI|nr:uncharacterized protein BDZ99DRAFT_548224 [Mytilinidion resinicola]KAF2802943.1 hypothetical protein BDZ99DRAFT_548224 [Mytilinidion resinicola]
MLKQPRTLEAWFSGSWQQGALSRDGFSSPWPVGGRLSRVGGAGAARALVDGRDVGARPGTATSKVRCTGERHAEDAASGSLRRRRIGGHCGDPPRGVAVWQSGRVAEAAWQEVEVLVGDVASGVAPLYGTERRYFPDYPTSAASVRGLLGALVRRMRLHAVHSPIAPIASTIRHIAGRPATSQAVLHASGRMYCYPSSIALVRYSHSHLSTHSPAPRHPTPARPALMALTWHSHRFLSVDLEALRPIVPLTCNARVLFCILEESGQLHHYLVPMHEKAWSMLEENWSTAWMSSLLPVTRHLERTYSQGTLVSS